MKYVLNKNMLLTAYVYRKNQADSQHCHQHTGAAVTHKRQSQACNGHNTDGHTDINKDLERKHNRNA